MNIKKFVLGAALALIAGAAIAQTSPQILPPYLTGTSQEHRREILESGMQRLAQVNTALTALAGGAQVGTALNMGVNRFSTVATAGDSAQLPAVAGAVMIYVINASAVSMNVFGQTGQTINALAVNTAFAVPAGKTAMFIQIPDGTWYALLSA